MKSLHRVSLGIVSLSLIGVIVASRISAQSVVFEVSPGTAAQIVCSTTLHVTPESPQSIHVDCDPEPSATATAMPSSTPTASATATATAVPPPTATTVPGGGIEGLWLSLEEIATLPTSGEAWDTVLSTANSSWGSPNLGDNNSQHDTRTLAGALVYARQGSSAMRQKVADAIMSAPETENSGRTLEISRNLVSYVIAADLIDFKTFDPGRESQFRTWLAAVRYEVLDGRTIISTHEDRPNNWGTMAGATRVAIARYLGDTADLDLAANVFHGWLGNRSLYAGFDYGELGWQCNPAEPVGINPVGCVKEGHDIDGVLPDDQRRTGGFTWPAPKGSYPHEALQGAFVQAQLLHRAGYPAWEWEDQALRRAYVWLYTVNQNPASGDDSGYPFLVNSAYTTSFAPGSSPHSSGKNMCCLSWTHGG